MELYNKQKRTMNPQQVETFTYWHNPLRAYVAYWASTTLCHLSHSCPFLLASPHVSLPIFNYVSNVCWQVLLGKTLLHCPWGFHSCAVWAMLPSSLLQVWPKFDGLRDWLLLGPLPETLMTVKAFAKEYCCLIQILHKIIVAYPDEIRVLLANNSREVLQ